MILRAVILVLAAVFAATAHAEDLFASPVAARPERSAAGYHA